MERIKELNVFTKSTLGLGFPFLIYGLLSHAIPIYFFWESQSIGWMLILIGMIGFLSHGVKKRRSNNQSIIGLNIGIGVICFVLFIQTLLLIIMPNTDAFRVSKDYLMNDEALKSEVGEIQGFGLVLTGSISEQSDTKGETGDAMLNIVVKGDKKFKKVTVYSSKTYDKGWEIYRVD